MITADQLALCRQVAESAMTGTLYITGPTAQRTNPATGVVEEVPGPARYGTAAEPGVGLVQAVGQGYQTEQIIGGQVVTVGTYAVKVPVTVTGVQPDDEVHIVTCGDPTMPGRTLIVSEPVAGNDLAIQRRILATLTTG